MTIVHINESIKNEIAERIVDQSHPGYSTDFRGEWYVVNGNSVVHAQRNRQWNPWSEDDAVISVDELAELGGLDHRNFDCFRTEIDWQGIYDEDWSVWSKAYEQSSEPNGPVGELTYELTSWAEENGFEDRVQQIEKEQFDVAVSFVLDYIPESYDTDDVRLAF